MEATKCMTEVGVFKSHEAADRAIAELKKKGYRDDQIGLVSKNSSGQTVKTDGSGTQQTKAYTGAELGAAAGGAIGAGVGAGILMGVIPVIGPVLAIGTLGTVLLNAVGGAALAGLAGALVGWGIPEENAKYYEGEVKAGRFLVTVECGYGDDARDIIAREGGYSRATAPATV